MFPILLDRYIIREFVKIFLAALSGFLFVCLVGDAAERLNEFVDASAPLRLILLFYLNQIPYYLIFILPASSLIATLFTLGQLSRYSELTAMLASGVSLGRVFRPILALMLAVSAASFLVDETVVPRANRNKEEIQEYRIRKRARPNREVRSRVDYQGENGRRWVAAAFRLDEARFIDVKLIQFAGPPEALHIDYRVDAAGSTYLGDGQWRFSGGTVRYFDPASRDEWVVRFDTLTLAGLAEKPEDFVIEVKEPQQMSFAELKREVARLRRNGMRTELAETELWFKTSLPVANFVIVLFGAPLAVTRRRMGPGVGIALGVVVYMLFMGTYYLTRSMGYNGLLSAPAAAWSANLIFAVMGAGLFFKVRK
ncbi:MAG: LptF/LptG family permease [Candidatus Glassbacteria bacterium]